MAGNVFEWCQDWYDSDHNTRILRGGSWVGNANYLRVARRGYNVPTNVDFNDFGFRCVLGSRK